MLNDLGNGRGCIPRGLGRSYGDSASNAGGGTISCLNLKDITIDTNSGVAVISSGVTIRELEEQSLALGFYPFVVPGTGNVTIGGAIASDIHGKSHHNTGSFGNHVLEIKLLTADGIMRVIQPRGSGSSLFWATVGGMGLTGLIVQATLKLKKIETQYVTVKEVRVKDLKELLATILEFDNTFLYTVAWVDLSGKFAGRGIVSGANHSKASEFGIPRLPKNHSVAQSHELHFPYPFKFSSINKFTISIFNRFWFYKPLGKKFQHLNKFMHPLDFFNNWNAFYGDKGFIQYQFAIPFEQTEVLRQVVEILRDSKCSSFLSVLKSFGDESEGMLSFPLKGWTLSVDLPLNNRNLSKALKEMDDLIVRAGGRIYLTKDSCLSSELMPLMYSRLSEWKKMKNDVDPTNFWQSDQGRRLKLC
jgi:decaprenylphospho-beta-D-ribofuranose 2-oxidase